MSNMFLNIVSTFKNDGIKQATSQLGAFGSAAGGLGSTLGKVGATLAGFGLATKAVQFTSQSIDSARDLERNMYSLNTVFGGMAPTMEKFTKGAHEIGLSQKDAAKASVFLGSVLKQSGFSMADTTKETQKLVSLGVDLATTYGYDVQEALLGMTALFRGEYDPIEKFGVAMKQSEINAELTARKLNHLTGAARRNQEQIIRMELLYERAADAMGAFTGQSGNLFVEQMKLQAQFENMQASIGTQLLPIMVSLTEALLPLVDFIGPKLAEAISQSIPVLEGFVAEIKNIGDATTFTGGTIKVLLDIFGGLFSFIAQNFGVLLSFTALIGAATAAVNLYTIAVNFAWTASTRLFGAITILGTGFIIGANAASNLMTELQKNKAAAESLNPELKATAYEVEYIGGKFGYMAGAASNANKETRALRDELLLLEASFAGSLTVYGGGKELRAQKRDEIRKGKKAAADAASSQATAAAQKAAQDQAMAQQQAARELAAAQEAAARSEEERQQRRLKFYESWGDAVKSTFGEIKDSILSSFNLPELGKSTNSITKNIKSLLDKTRAFAKNIRELSEQGLTNDLLQQVIQAGPMDGGNLAKALVGGGSGFIGQLNEAYGEFSGLAGGIADVGARSAFAREQVVNNYNIEIQTVAGDPIAIERVVLDAISRANRRGTTGLTV
jgi:hypothetical protein